MHALTSELGEVDRRLALLRLSLPPAYSRCRHLHHPDNQINNFFPSNFSTPELRREGSVGSGSATGSSGERDDDTFQSDDDNRAIEEILEILIF